MSRPLSWPCLLTLLLCGVVSSRALAHGRCADEKTKRIKALGKTTLAAPEEAFYDVTQVRLNLSMTNTSTQLGGDALITGKVIAPSLSEYVFELDGSHTIDSAKVNGQLLPVTTTGFVRRITLPAPLTQNTIFQAQIWYHGTPPNGTGFFTAGVNHNVLGSGTQITFTLSDPYLAKDWWPCKQDLNDKVDSAAIWITVPAGLKAGSNGLLQAVTPVSGGNRYEWKTRYPIEYYLLSVAVAPYIDHSYYMHFSGGADSMLVQNYIYDSASVFAQYRPAIDSTGLMIDFLSEKFGRYPFWQEKYGHCMAPLGGGMEHQTMTTLGVVQTPLIAHELGHQWWGNHVTYASWKDIWLSEGWASYVEQLYVEHFRGIAAAKDYRTAVFNRVIASSGGSVYVDDTSNVYRIFDSRLTYDKGSAVAHMLRYIAPDDTHFFDLCKTWQQQYSFKTATTADFQALAEQVYGFDLDTFFQQWVYKEGFPRFTARWNQKGSKVYLLVNQTGSRPLSVAAFSTPLEIRLGNLSGSDTTVKVYVSQASQLFSFDWTGTMSGVVTFDPDDHILNNSGTITKDNMLSVGQTAPGNIRIYPNPSRNGWQLSNLPEGSALTLHNDAGQQVWRGTAANPEFFLHLPAIAAGTYYLEIANRHKVLGTVKLLQLK